MPSRAASARAFDRSRDAIAASGLYGSANVIMQLALLPVGRGVAESTVDSGRVDKHPFKRQRTTGQYLVVAMLGSDAEREAIACGDAAMQAQCVVFHHALHEKAQFALKINPDAPWPFGKEIRAQCGGVRGLAEAIGAVAPLSRPRLAATLRVDRPDAADAAEEAVLQVDEPRPARARPRAARVAPPARHVRYAGRARCPAATTRARRARRAPAAGRCPWSAEQLPAPRRCRPSSKSCGLRSSRGSTATPRSNRTARPSRRC